MEKLRAYSYFRFSTTEQLKGDSLRRQLDSAKRYADQNNLILDETLTYKDIGVSAYTGANKKNKSALGLFLDAIKTGRIPEGSVLIVESFDRISRERFTDAYQLFSEIIEAVKIATLSDGQEYTKESINENPAQIHILIGVILRAHEESKIKSFRLHSVWEEKRNQISKRKLTSIGPSWLEYDGYEFQVIEDRCKLVEEIYKLSLSGVGMESIAKQLNERVEPSWGRSNGWRKSTISKILKNKAVLGEFQPHKKRGGKRIPVGSPVEGYYPQIVSEDLFYQVQNRLNDKPKHGGRTGKLRNLFGGLAKCAYCGSPMQFVNKGKLPKGGKYLICDNARRGLGCEYISVKYPLFEKVFLDFCSNLNVKDILHSDEKTKNIATSLRSQINSLKGQLNDVHKKIENLTNAISEEGRAKLQEHLKDELELLLTKQESLDTELKKIVREHEKATLNKSDAKRNINALQVLKRKMLEAEDEGSIYIKFKLRNQIRSIVDYVEVFPAGRIYTNEFINKYFMEIPTDYERELLLSKPRDRSKMFFRVHYVNGNLTVITPNNDTSTGYEKSYAKEGDWITCRLGSKHIRISSLPLEEDDQDYDDDDTFYENINDPTTSLDNNSEIEEVFEGQCEEYLSQNNLNTAKSYKRFS